MRMWMVGLATAMVCWGEGNGAEVRRLDELASRYTKQGIRQKESEMLWRRALELRMKEVGEAGEGVAELVLKLGGACVETGQVEEAERHFRRVLELEARSRGPDVGRVAAVYNNLAVMASAEGRKGEAEGHLSRALAALESGRGLEDPDLIWVYLNRAKLRVEMKAMTGAEADVERAMRIVEAHGGSESVVMIGLLEVYGGILKQTRRGREAKVVADRVKRMRAQHVEARGEGHLVDVSELVRSGKQ